MKNISVELQIQNILFNKKSELKNLNILLKELEKNPIKSFGKKTIEKLNKKI
jgi:hypothetical protein